MGCTRFAPAWRLPLILVALALVRGLLWMALTPPWQGPDEPRHFQYARLVLDLRRVPSVEDAHAAADLQREVYRSLVSQRYYEVRGNMPAPADANADALLQLNRSAGLVAAVVHPPLYYSLCALILWPFRSASVETQLYILRLLSVVLGAVLVCLTYVVSGWLWPDDAAPCILTALFVALLPMHAFMSGVQNNDCLAEVWAAGVFALLVGIALRGGSPTRWAGLAACLVLALWTKRTTVFLVPLVFLSLPWVAPAAIRRGRWCSWLTLVSGLCVVAALVLSLLPGSRALVGWVTLEPLRAWAAAGDQTTVATLVHFAVYGLLGFASFWANFGWMNIPLDVGWYGALAVLTVAAAAGWWRFGRRMRLSGESGAWSFWCIATLAVALAVLQALALMVARNQPPQGRYTFTALVPIAVAFTAGWSEWVPDRLRRGFERALIICLVLFDVACTTGYALPFFYG
jgi:hypothetical protein